MISLRYSGLNLCMYVEATWVVALVVKVSKYAGVRNGYIVIYLVRTTIDKGPY